MNTIDSDTDMYDSDGGFFIPPEDMSNSPPISSKPSSNTPPSLSAKIEMRKKIKRLPFASAAGNLTQAVSDKVVGSANFYVPMKKEDNSHIWKCHTVTNKRIGPDDPIFHGGTGLIALACPNYEKMNNGARGHSAMVFYQQRWILVWIWRLDPDKVTGYVLVDLNFDAMNLSPIEINLNSDNIIFQFVSVYGCNEKINDPAFINPIDGKFNAGSRPSSCYLPHPSPATKEQTSDPGTNKPPTQKET